MELGARKSVETRSRLERRPAYRRPIQELLLSPWIVIPAAFVLAAFLSTQFFQIRPRYIKLVVGLATLLVVTRLPLHRSLILFLLIFPVPTFVFVGDTNVLFIGLLLVVWVARMQMGLAPRPMRSPIDWAVFLYIGAHLISFLNVETEEGLRRGLQVMSWMTAGPVLYFLLYNNLRNEEHLRRVFQALCALSLFVGITGLLEYWFNGYKLVPDWYLWRGGMTIQGAQRVGGIFGFHGLLADFSAMMFYVQIFMASRSHGRLAKTYYLGLALLSLVMLALAVNRGGVAAWLMGGLYYFFLVRKEVSWQRVGVALPAVLFAFLGVQMLTSNFFSRLRVLGRLTGTRFEGVVPENRVNVWNDILGRVPDHLWTGHGPWYALGGVGDQRLQWPHSGYLFYLYTTGVFGLVIWVWMLVKLAWKTFPGAGARMVRGTFAQGAMTLVHVHILMFAAVQLRDSHQRGNVYLYVMWILFAIAAISHRLVLQQREQRRPATAPVSRSEPKPPASRPDEEAPFRPGWYHRAD